MSKNSIVITGASGFVAKNLRKFLISKGYDIIGVSRNNYNASRHEKKILVKSYDKDHLISKLKNCYCIIHLVGIGKTSITTDFQKTNVDLTKKIIEIAKGIHCQKIIYLSGLGVESKSTNYFISKYLAEKDIINSGIPYILFRPSYIIGKNDYLTKNLNKQAKSEKIIIPGSGKYHIQPIRIDDVCKIIYQSLNKKRFLNKVIDLVGPERLTYESYVKKFNKKLTIQKIPLEKIFYNSINNLNSCYDIDDLLLLLGDFTGNHKKLEKLSNIKLQKVF